MNTEDNQPSTENTHKPELTVCKRCHGQGTTVYANTATWHGGIGGDMMRNDVCDKCWGTGFMSHPGPNRRRGEHPTAHVERIAELEQEVARLKIRDKQHGEMVLPIVGYMQEQGGADKWGIRLGESIFKKILEILQTQSPSVPPQSSGEPEHTSDLMHNWEIGSIGYKTRVYKRTGEHETTLIASCFNEEIATLIARAPQMPADLAALRTRNSELESTRDKLMDEMDKTVHTLGQYLFYPHPKELMDSLAALRTRNSRLVEALKNVLSLSQDTQHPDADYLLEEIEVAAKSALQEEGKQTEA